MKHKRGITPDVRVTWEGRKMPRGMSLKRSPMAGLSLGANLANGGFGMQITVELTDRFLRLAPATALRIA